MKNMSDLTKRTILRLDYRRCSRNIRGHFGYLWTPRGLPNASPCPCLKTHPDAYELTREFVSEEKTQIERKITKLYIIYQQFLHFLQFLPIILAHTLVSDFACVTDKVMID